ncbi:phage tail assembly protein T [Streptomyces sp. ECR3.8]|uniref:phage tail assembly protein T n=1 Tax=Streptomyces sp. ECR3.8 TaxID=3461009 RepID=UPI004041C453
MPELLARTSSAELTEWMAYERVTGPLGPERMDALFATLAATVANTARAKGRKAEPKDFMPKWDQGDKGFTDWEQMLDAVKSYNRQIGGTDLTTKGGAAGGDA